MLPSELYLRYLKDHDLSADPAQQRTLLEFDELARRLGSPDSWATRLGLRPRQRIRGVYLWGGVGRGKTLLMDMLYDAVPGVGRMRRHFHHFMRYIHAELGYHRHKRNPLQRVAARIAGQTRLLCLDEFYVADITDAMLLAGLLEALFEQGLILVTTSNIHPDNLYANGLQRARFLPAIELLKRNTRVLELEGGTDYRLKTLRKDGTYHCPADDTADEYMRDAFDRLSSHTDQTDEPLEINGRCVPVVRRAEGAVWFDFQTLCDSPRSQDDYIEIACEHHSVFLTGLPVMDDRRNDAARRLLNLLDVLYDARVKLVVSADAPIDNIYKGDRLRYEFRRAASRLIEMQSESYLTLTHRG